MAEKIGLKKEKESPSSERLYELLSESEKGADVTARDDQYDLSAFLDAARVSRKRGGRFRLVDTGKFSLFQLEWLAKAGADIYTSDEARPSQVEISLLSTTCRQSMAIVAYVHHGELMMNGRGEPTSLAFLMDICRNGAYFHISNRVRKRDFQTLRELAYACGKAGTRLVYYHHGHLDVGMDELIGQNAWVHITDESLRPAGDAAHLLEMIRQRRGTKVNLVLHIEEGLELEILRDYLQAGVHILFKTPPSDYKSAFRRIERLARKRKLDWRAYYLYTTLLP